MGLINAASTPDNLSEDQVELFNSLMGSVVIYSLDALQIGIVSIISSLRSHVKIQTFNHLVESR